MIHIGHRIKEVLEAGPPEWTVSWFAEQLCSERTTPYKIFSRPYIRTDILEKVSEILEHNFFEDLNKAYGNTQYDINALPEPNTPIVIINCPRSLVAEISHLLEISSRRNM